jgi:hypothetical protein
MPNNRLALAAADPDPALKEAEVVTEEEAGIDPVVSISRQN